MSREDLKKIKIDDLLCSEQISVRTVNCCNNARFDTLFDIISYFEQGESFSNIRNAGRKTCLELEELCKKTLAILSGNDSCHINIVQRKELNSNASLPRYADKETMELYLSLTSVQKEELKTGFNHLLQNYSVRTKNSLSAISIEEFILDFLCFSDDKLLKIKNFGKISLNEGIEFKHRLKRKIQKLSSIPKEQLEKERKLNKYGISNNEFCISFYEKHDHFPMFWILEQHLKHDKTRDIEILIDLFPIFQNKPQHTLEEVADKQRITRERVRQIRNDVFYKTFEITDDIIDYKNKSILLKYVQLLQNKNDWAYILDVIGEAEIVSPISYEIQEKLKKEECLFSVEFVLQIIAYIFRDEFAIYGGFDVNNRDKSWKSIYLIRKTLTKIFDFEKMKEEFNNKLVDNTTDYLIDLENYIANTQSWKQFDFDKINEITKVVKDLLLHEFGLYSEDIDGNLIKIPANKERNLLDVVYEILQTKGEPMHLDEIFVEFKRIMPEHKYTQENNMDRLRPYLQRHDDITFRKRSSIYILKEWRHIRSGTIRDVILEFLLANDLPQTVETITEYVLQHFPETNQKNIHSTMFSGKNFVQFKDGLFGLVSKEYSLKYEAIERESQRKSFEQRLTDLEKFIVENEHFPFSSSEDKEEESLCRWWCRIVSGKQTVNETQQKEVERIKRSYTDYDVDKNAYEWNLNYNKFKMFILENRRVPSARGDEKFLYGWLRRAKNDFLNYRLSEEQRKKYIELAKLI
ncbi:hypothetical protein M2137_001785 [Parabacteroides sp. PFB2-10]|uniref:DNA-directed RNA polymerase subunit alpha C-terminal domain-containing protein n=1 Tax=Parabacteroides sp. PFB2-10 TaxID=1742405 RepID=UPI002476D69B|nr:DNA-directed RNA polymerase subunit alpha C-terminal domain-containing protein [Parabacteroides sp. PFB2-10]MDH6312998.1 hypothetical protein [Parabacteroides sp. PFB2-10]